MPYKDVELMIKCDDLLNYSAQGNKFWKLKYNFIQAQKEGKKSILTFGGAFSNHIYAVAATGKKLNFNTIGLIRGEIKEPLNPTLAFAKRQGMELIPISRQDYRKKDEKDFITSLEKRFDSPYIIPEGGTNSLAVKGCSEMLLKMEEKFDYICCACGTGGTLAGLIVGAAGEGQILGFPALKGGDFLKEDIASLIYDYNEQTYNNWKLVTDYHFKGYAKFNTELIDFINDFKKKHDVQLEPVYTGKMLYGIMDLIQKGYFPKGSRILAIHTGGLQGIAGFNERFGGILK